MGYRFDFNRHAGRGFGIFSPRLNHDIRIGGGIINQIERTVRGIEHIASGEFRPGPDGGHHRSTGRPAGDHWDDRHDHRDSGRYRDEPRRNWREDMAARSGRDYNEREDRLRRSGETSAPAAQSSSDTPRSRERAALARNMGPEALEASDRLLNLPPEQFETEFNKLPLAQKQEILNGYNKTYEGVTNTRIHLNAQGNLDTARLRSDTQASMQATVAAVANSPSSPGVSVIRTLTPEEVDAAARAPLATTVPPVDRATALGQAIGIDGIRAQGASEAPSSSVANWTQRDIDNAGRPSAPAAGAPPKPINLSEIASGTPVTTKLLNQIEYAVQTGEIKRQTVGQGADAREIYIDKSGKVIGGLDHNEKNQTTSFLGRDKLDAELGPTGKTVASIERGIEAIGGSVGVGVAASNKPAEPVPVAADQGTKSNIALNMTANMGGFTA